MKLVLHLCPKPVLLPQSCCDVSVLHPRIPDLHSQKKSRRHIFTLIEGNETGWLTFTRIYLYWKSQAEQELEITKPQIKQEPPAQLPGLSCSVLVSPAFDIPKCMAHYRMSACSVGKAAHTPQKHRNKPQHREGRRRGIVLMRRRAARG